MSILIMFFVLCRVSINLSSLVLKSKTQAELSNQDVLFQLFKFIQELEVEKKVQVCHFQMISLAKRLLKRMKVFQLGEKEARKRPLFSNADLYTFLCTSMLQKVKYNDLQNVFFHMKLHENFPLLTQQIKGVRPKGFIKSLHFSILCHIIELEFKIQQQRFMKESIYNIRKFLSLEKKIISLKDLMT